MGSLVAWDGNVHRAQKRVYVTHSSGRQVHIRCLCERLVVSPGIRKHQKLWFPEGCLELVNEGSRCATASSRSSSGSSRKLQHSPLASVSEGDHPDISRVFNGHNGTRCLQKFLPGLLQMCDVDATTLPFVDVLFHLKVKVGATLGSCCKESEDILILHLRDVKGSDIVTAFL